MFTPLLGDEHLSKSAVSRVAGLQALVAAWGERDLSEGRYAIVFLGGFYLKQRMARRT